MNDYIKREDAKNMMRKFEGYYDEDAIARFEIALGAGYIPPNEDVVEVVRCKDCKYGHLRDNTKRNSSIYCDFGIGVHKENYCSFGERRTVTADF